MPEIPESVRFHFARQAPSPWNWYTKPEFAGCRLHWTPPAENVASYIIFRSSEGLSSDCCEDLLNGMYEDVADRIDVFKQISQLVDDEIHDKNRYLVLAQLENDDIVWVSDVDSEQFTGPVNDEPLTYWSNPFGDSPKIKDPCRLDYATVRVDNFCGFEWDYPSQYPDFLGFELIVCDVPYSPHTGADSDISAFREVLSGERGQHYMLDRFVTAIVDNDSFVNRFWYYALLVRLPESGRVQIPLRHVSEPFESGTPYMNLRPQPTWGVGRERMMAAFAKWKAKAGQMQRSDSVSDLYSTPAAEAISADTGAVLEFFRHAPDLTLNSFIENPKMIGIQFSAKVNDGTEIIAIRSKEELSDAESRQLLQKAHEDRIVNGSDADAFAFVPKNGYMVLVDSDCHNKSNYAFATYDRENDTFAELSHVKDTTIDFIPLQDDTIRWGYPGQVFSNRNMHCLRLEKIPKKNVLTLEFGILDDTNVCRIELYVFDNEPEFSEDNLEDLHSFVESGSPRLGQRYVIDHLCHNIIDDVSRCDATHYYGAASLDMHGNRTSISVFSLGSTEREDTEYLSDVAGVAKSMPDEAGSDEPRDAHDSDQEDSGIRQRPSRRRSRWEDLIEQSSDADDISSDSGYEHIAVNADDSGSSSDSDRYSRSSQSAVRSARRFSWDDDDSSSIPSGDHETVQTDEKPEPAEAPSSQSSDRYSRSSQSAVHSARRFSWDDDDSSLPTDNPDDDIRNVDEEIVVDDDEDDVDFDDDENMDMRQLSRDEIVRRGIEYARSPQSKQRPHSRYSWEEVEEEPEESPEEINQIVEDDLPDEIPDAAPLRRSGAANQSAGRSRSRFSWDDDDDNDGDNGQQIVEEEIVEQIPDADAAQFSRSSAANQSAGRSRSRFSWDDDNDEPQPQEPQTIEESKPAEDHSLDILDSDDEDTAAIKTIARCRQLLESGDKQSAVDLIQQAQEKYPDNLRLEAFAWNYLDA